MKLKTCKDKICRRLINDFRQKELIPLKMVFFVHSSTIFVLYPYLTIHMRELGINVEETAIMSALTPCVAILMPPISGMIADRIGNFKILLALFSGLGGLVALLLLFVPVGRVAIPFPDQIAFAMYCSNESNGHFKFTVAEGEKCLKISSSAINEGSLEAPTVQPPLDYANITVALNSCGLLCSTSEQESNINYIMENSKKYMVTIEDELNNSSVETHTYNVSSRDFVFLSNGNSANDSWKTTHGKENIDVRSYRVQKKVKNFRTSVQSFAHNEYFFPTPDLFNFACDLQTENEINNCTIKKFARDSAASLPYKKFIFSSLRPIYNVSNADEITGFTYQNYTEAAPVIAYCYRERWKTSATISYTDKQSSNEKQLEFNQCKPHCIMTTSRKNVCKNRFNVIEYDVKFTFTCYLMIRLLIGMIGGTAFAMFEGAVIAILREKKADYGLQRIYASIGGMISSPLSGYLIDYYSKGKGYTDFRPAFYFYAFLKVSTSFLMLYIDLEFKAPAKNVVSDVMRVLRKLEVMALLFSSFILGTAWGYIESFLFWLLQDLGANRSLMGITITVGGIAGIPLLILSGPIIDNIGHANVIFIGFIFYAIRLAGYSLITSAWQCLIFEAMESVTSSLAFTAAVTYAAKLSNTQTDSSIQGVIGGLYFGVGKGTGSLIGGYLIKYVGSRNTYRIFSIATFVFGCGYYALNKYYISKHPSDENESKDENKVDLSNLSGDTPPAIVPNGDVTVNSINKEELQKSSK